MYLWIGHQATKKQEAKDAVLITQLNQTIGAQKQTITNDSTAFSKIKQQLDDNLAALRAAQDEATNAIAQAMSAHAAVVRTRIQWEEKYKAELRNPRNAKLVSKDCEFSDANY